jgi:hypothetical protein
MKSGGQIDGQMSFLSPVVWWYREVNCEVVGLNNIRSYCGAGMHKRKEEGNSCRKENATVESQINKDDAGPRLPYPDHRQRLSDNLETNKA